MMAQQRAKLDDETSKRSTRIDQKKQHTHTHKQKQKQKRNKMRHIMKIGSVNQSKRKQTLIE